MSLGLSLEKNFFFGHFLIIIFTFFGVWYQQKIQMCHRCCAIGIGIARPTSACVVSSKCHWFWASIT